MTADANGRGAVLTVNVKGPEGALSLELSELREGVARGFLRPSPRNLRLSDGSARSLSDQLVSRGYSRILVQDNRKGLLRRSLPGLGWRVERAIQPTMARACTVTTTYDLPLDETLLDDREAKPELSGTDHMVGVCIDLGTRKAWGFYTDDGNTARVVSEGDRRQGMLVAGSADDMARAAECLVQFLAASRKTWAVFSTHMGRYVRRYDPTTMWRLALDRPTAYDHVAKPLSKANKRDAVRLFSEYYDEPTLQAMLRLRRFQADRAYSTYLVDGGFVVLKDEGASGLVYDIYVSPSRQGEGLGGELMRCAITSFVGKPAGVYLHTSYPRAKVLYEKFGFKPVYSSLAVRLDELALVPPGAGEEAGTGHRA